MSLKQNYQKMKNFLSSYKTTFIGFLGAFIFAVQSGAMECIVAGQIDTNCIWKLLFSACIAGLGWVAKDFNVTNVKTVTLIAMLSISFSSQISAQSVVDDGERFHNVYLPAPQPSGAMLISRFGLIYTDTTKLVSDTNYCVTMVSSNGNFTTTICGNATNNGGEAFMQTSDSNGRGGRIGVVNGLDGKKESYIDYSVDEDSSQSIVIDSSGINFQYAKTTQSNYYFPPFSPLWFGTTKDKITYTSGTISTVSGSDTIWLTTTGVETGQAIYKPFVGVGPATPTYSVVISPVSSDSTVYSYKVTKADKYFTVIVRQSNILFHFAPVADATKIDYVTAGKLE